jgi:two-component system chemotaxis sensor kinase CheA
MSNEFAQDPEMVREFLLESEELLQKMDQDMVALETSPSDGELLNRVFRAMHTIKGTAGFLGFDTVVRLSHRAEDVLNALRRTEVSLSRRMMDALLSARDQLGIMLEDIRNHRLGDYALDALLGELDAVQKASDIPMLGQILIQQGLVTPQRVEEALAQQADKPESERKRIGEILVEKEIVSAEQVGEALARQKQISEAAASAPSQTMRVDVHKLDELINLIGELVLERNRLTQLSRELGTGRISLEEMNSSLSQSATQLSFITEELQSAGLKARMVPVDTVFGKFPRLVRDVARSLQKEVELVVVGQETELDKTMVELIADPLVHLVRNALDHGIEPPERRAAAGKNPAGTIRLEARHEGDQIVIGISDDGAGIDPERIARKAIEKGLLTAERARALSTREILDFIFLPGFSTAERTTDISGRGVGMDVVRSNLKKLDGTVDLDSHPGAGTSVFLRLPLTLAILPVLLVEGAGEIYALPLRSVIETARLVPSDVHRVEQEEVLFLRNEAVPLVRLGALFGSDDRAGALFNQKVVLLGIGERRIALLVDRLVGQESTVVKPLGSCLHGCPGVAGATIGGDGRVRLVLDIGGVLTSLVRRVPQDA